jgi:hypothetical protein
MRKKRIIITIVVVLCVLAFGFFVMRFGVVGRIYNAINKLVVENKAESEKEEGPEELKYETLHDKDGNEIVVEMRKIIVFDEEGNEVVMWEDTAEGITIYDNEYLGRIEKIEDNKIYFMVDKEIEFNEIEPGIWKLSVKNLEDYQIIFDIDTYDFEFDPSVEYDVCDSLTFDLKPYYSAYELEFLVGEYLEVHDSMSEDYYTGEIHKSLYLQLASIVKSFIFSLF